MKCAVAIVLAFLGMVVANPVPSSLSLGSPWVSTHQLLPSAVSVSSSVINHGISIPRVVVAAPVIRQVVAAPIVSKVVVPVSSIGLGGLGGLGWGGLNNGLSGWNGVGVGSWGLGGKGWH